jgi:hypothetical protein
MSDAISNLQQAIKTAATASFVMDAAFLTASLNDTTVTVPADYDSDVALAFQLATGAKFTVQVAPANVGAVSDNSFTVTNATVPLVGSTSTSTATIVFGLSADSKTLVVQVASTPNAWTWTDSFPFMIGYPFNVLTISGTQLVFSTDSGTYPWTNAAGQTVVGGPQQNFSASAGFPEIAQPLLTLFGSLSAPAGAITLAGALDLSTYDGVQVLFPTGTLSAQLSSQTFNLVYLNVTAPALTLTLPAPSTDEEDEGDQTPTLSLSAGLGTTAGTSPYVLEVQIPDPMPGATATGYSIGLTATGDGPPLTPADITDLVPGGKSFLAATPALLQQFLTSVGLLGLNLSGSLSSPTSVTNFGIQICSTPGKTWTPIPNAPTGLDFTMLGFSLLWSVQYPLDSSKRTNFFLFETQFTLAPKIFKGNEPNSDGIFTVEFDSNLQFYASFDGTASLSDFLGVLTNGAVTLESVVTASISDIRLAVNGQSLGFTFSAGFDAGFNLLTVGGKPLLSIAGGQVSLSAATVAPSTPPPAPKGTHELQAAGDQTVWTGSISGALSVGPLTANVSVAYDGTLDPPRWNLSAALAQPINVQQLLDQFLSTTGYDCPSFLPGTLTVNSLGVTAVIPSGKGTLAASYTINTSFSWLFTLGDQPVGLQNATIQLAYDGNKAAGAQFSGAATATWIYAAINLKLTLGYAFGPSTSTQKALALAAAPTTNQTLYVDWEGFRATYVTNTKTLTFSLKGWTIGSLIQALVRTLGDPYFTLSSPWSLLNEISLDGLSVAVSLDSTVTNRVSASYTLSSPINLGFLSIQGITFRRDTTGKVTIAINGTAPPALQKSFGSLLDPNTGQDVKNLPSVPGRGNDYFKVFLLVLGQRIGITGYETFKDTNDVITALQKVPSTTGNSNPVNPNGNQGNPAKGVPYYNRDNNWTIAAHLGLLQVAGVWTVDVMVVFNDPNLYGMRLALAGPKAGGLAGMAIDILYKKISDDIGLFQIEFTFPDSIRNINLGAVSITLPQIGIQVYTNGDFLIDIGFPYNLDFRRSFSIYAIIYGIPVIGSGGFYFGKLSSATSTSVPATTAGTFSPVIVFGIGLQIGFGYNFTFGPLSAGFALTVFGIIEGVIAAWHPYTATTNKQLASNALSSGVQTDYYFKLKGQVGIIGLLYGKIDFAIIQASVNVKFTVSLQITYESYRQIPIVANVSLSISVSVKIDLGIFSFSISFSFSANLTAGFQIGSNETAPWDTGRVSSGTNAFTLDEPLRRPRFRSPDEIARRARNLRLRPRRVVASNLLGGLTAQGAATKPVLNVLTAPQFTVLAPEGATSASAQQGAFVLLFAMDAPASGRGDGTTSFEMLCTSYLPWIINAMSQAPGDTVDLAAAAAASVTREDLEDYIQKLSDTESTDLTITALLQFLSSTFTLNIEPPTQSNGNKLAAANKGSVLFPVFDGLNLAVPAASGSGISNIAYATYATANSAYRTTVANTFAQVEAILNTQNQQSNNLRLNMAVDDPESMAALVFTDTFALIGRQLMQAAVNALDNFAYPLNANDSLETIVDWANNAGNTLTADDIGVSNPDHPLSPSLPLTIPSWTYTQQSGDTLNSIAKACSDSAASPRWTITPATLITTNGLTRSLQANIPLTIQGANGPVPHVTIVGDNFQNIADVAGITLAALSTQTALYTVPGLLQAAGFLTIPALTYTTPPSTGTADTLNSISKQFSVAIPALCLANATVQNLFASAGADSLLSLPKLDALPITNLWTAIQATGQVAQTASMVSRFLMYGLRLPNTAGLTLSSAFLYPTTQTAYALYQLTGQQFPTPAQAPSGGYSVTISRDTTSHGVDLSFIEFNGAPATSLNLVLDAAYNLSSIVVAWAQTGAFQPSPTYTALPLCALTPKAFAVEHFALWATSDYAALQALTTRSTTTTAAPSTPAQPLLFALPDALLQQVDARQTALQPLGSFSDTITRMPRFTPQAGSTSPASNQTQFSDLQTWTWATRIDFQIKRLPASAIQHSTDTTDATVPPPSADAPTLPNAYEVIGASSADVLLLEQLLSAMDDLGEAIAPAVFLSYALPSPSGQTLTTLGDAQFLAFLAQTNLSTETNPVSDTRRLARLAANPAPSGIGNSTHEFLRLLWELSVVRSGGYFLYYETVDGGSGLPASLFDNTGTATVSAVVAYAPSGSSSFGTTVLNFVNSVLTTDSIDTSRDVLRVLSTSAPATSAAMTGTTSETLRAVAALYGDEPGGIVSLNPTLPLTGCTVTVNGIWRQLTAADLTDPTKTLANLATYYSAGAKTTITATDIQNLNPGVPVALASVFAIPSIQYVVAQNSAPGNTFGSIGIYYGLSPDAIATLFLDVPSIFTAGATLSLDSQTFDLSASAAPGNISIELVRQNLGQPATLPSNPTPQQKADYAQAFMYQLYQTLSAGLVQNPYFKPGSPFGLPFGPQQQTSDDGLSAFASQSVRMQHRQNRLAAAADSPFEYTQTIGIAKFAQINAAPASPAPGLPPQSANPYLGVGTVAQVSLRWQDLFGNTTLTPFEQPSPQYAGALNGAANLILYNDLLIAPSSWPSVQTSYTYTGAAGSPTLTLEFKLDTTHYSAPNDQATRDLEQFTLIYFQLHQDYTNLGVPGVTGNAVSMSLCNQLLASPEITLTEAQCKQIRDFVASSVQWLSNFLSTKPATLPTPLTDLTIAIQPAQLASGNIIELGLDFVLTRQAILVQNEVAALDDGLSVTSTILPLSNISSSGSVVYTDFATNFEATFQTTDWYLKIGEGIAQSGGGAPGNSEQLYAVRFGNASGKGIYFEIGDTPSYYAPKPIAKALESRSATIIDYKTGNSSTSSFSGVDLNLWFQTCLDAVDTFLSAQYATPAFILDKLLGNDPMKTGYFGKVLTAKQTLADAIAAAVVPILSTSATDTSSCWIAQNTMRQRLLIALGDAYAAGAVVLYGLSGLTGAASANPDNLYGQPAGSLPQGNTGSNQNFALSAARFPLTSVQDGTKTYDPRVAFTFTSKNVTEQSYVPLDLGLNLTHLEFDRETVPGIDGYVQSRWLVFVNGPFYYQLGKTTANVPIVDRALPAPPTVQRQLAVQSQQSPTKAADLPSWNYSFDYLYQAVAQDTIKVSLEINDDPNSPKSFDATAGPDLFTALAQFTTSWPAISADLETYLPKIHAAVPPADVQAAAVKAVSTFQQYIAQVATAYSALATAKTKRFASTAPEKIEIDFELSLQSALTTNYAQTVILGLTINGVAATWDAATNTISNGTITLPAVSVLIEADQYLAEPVSPAPPNVSIAYQYKNRIDGTYLPYLQAGENYSRTIAMDGLNVLKHQNAWSSILVERNKYLFPIADIANVQTASDFLFQTPLVRFANVVVPQLVYPSFAMGAIPATGTPTFESLLETFFAQLFTGGNGSISIEAAANGSYSYELFPNLPRVSLPINYLPPTEVLVDPSTPPALCAVLAASIQTWRTAQQPTLTGNPQIDLILTIFGGLSEQQPLLVIQDLTTDIS